MNERVIKIVEAVVRQNSRTTPADGVLRIELKRQKELSPDLARKAARAVFAIFRWRGWIDATRTIVEGYRGVG